MGLGPCQSSIQNPCSKISRHPTVYCICNSSYSLSYGTYLFLHKQWFIILAIESCNNRPMKIAEIVATLPSNYTCDSFIYLLVQQLNLHPRLMVNCGSALYGNNSGGKRRLDPISWKKAPFNKHFCNELCNQNSQQQARTVKRGKTPQYLHVEIKHQSGKMHPKYKV